MARLSHSARLLYVGLWCLADDEGRGRLLPKQIEGEVFPNENVEFGPLWAELEALGRVTSYQVDGETFFHIPRFEDYQKPNRKVQSRLPAPPTQRVSSAPAHAGEGEGEGEGAAAFTEFNMQRARSDVTSQQRSGLRVRSLEGLARTIAVKPDFVEESKHIWNHRYCTTCRGKGFTEDYAPGAGVVKVRCEVSYG
jgi:hypothetical protein